MDLPASSLVENTFTIIDNIIVLNDEDDDDIIDSQAINRTFEKYDLLAKTTTIIKNMSQKSNDCKALIYKQIIKIFDGVSTNYKVHNDHKFNIMAIDMLASYINFQCIKFKLQTNRTLSDARYIANSIYLQMRSILKGNAELMMMVILKTDIRKKKYAHILYPLCKKIHQSLELFYPKNIKSINLFYILVIIFYTHWRLIMRTEKDKMEFDTEALISLEKIYNLIKDRLDFSAEEIYEFKEHFRKSYFKKSMRDLYESGSNPDEVIKLFFFAYGKQNNVSTTTEMDTVVVSSDDDEDDCIIISPDEYYCDKTTATSTKYNKPTSNTTNDLITPVLQKKVHNVRFLPRFIEQGLCYNDYEPRFLPSFIKNGLCYNDDYKQGTTNRIDCVQTNENFKNSL